MKSRNCERSCYRDNENGGKPADMSSQSNSDQSSLIFDCRYEPISPGDIGRLVRMYQCDYT